MALERPNPGVLRELLVPFALLCVFSLDSLPDDIPPRAGECFRGQLLETGNSD